MYTSKYPLNARIVDFPDPFVTFSNIVYPTTMQEVLYWSDRLWLRNGIYSQAIKKCVRYFLNSVELSGDDLSNDVRRKYEQFLMDQLNILDLLAQVGDDVVAYGNSFTSVALPVRRMLVCSKCKLERPLEGLEADADYKWKNYTFVGKCPVCRTEGEYLRIDKPQVTEEHRIQVIRWAPQFLSINYCPVTGDADYEYDIPRDVQAGVKEGNPVFLRSMPWEMVEAVKSGKPFRFNKQTFYHLRCNTSASISTKLRGWGLPLFMSNFNQVVHLQILERFNEAIAMDYIVPFRVVSPPAGGSLRTDPMLTNNMGNFMGAVRRMIKQHRQDPTTWHTLPFPVEYQALGGEAKALVPVELIDRAIDSLLTSMGVPQEFYRGSISLHGGPPISLRMFEKTWTHHTAMLDDWLNWFIGQCGRMMGWEGGITAALERTSILEDEMGKQVKLNLASSRVISSRTALRSFGIDIDQERKQMLEEDRMMQERLREEQKREEITAMVSSQMGVVPPQAYAPNMGLAPAGPAGPAPGGPMPGGPAPAGGPMPGGQMPGMGNPSVDKLMAQAEQIAQQIMMLDPTSRRNTLVDLKRGNPTLHAQVKQLITDMEQGIKSNALAQAKAQGGGGMPM